MPRAGTTTKQRAKEGLPPLKPGKPGWVQGSKLPFMETFRDAFLAAVEVKKQGALYDTIAHEYLDKYGYHTAWDGDLEEGQVVADDVDPDEDVNALSPEEANSRAAYFKKLRAKIGVWLNAQYGSGVGRGKKKMTFVEAFGKAGLELAPPVKKRVLHYFSNRFYDELIRDRVATRWALAQKLPKPPAIVSLRSKITKEVWGEQTQAFKDALMAARETEHTTAKEAYAMATSGGVPKSAEEYGVALNNAAYYLQPFVEAAAERYGMNVSLMMSEEECRARSWKEGTTTEPEETGSSHVTPPPDDIRPQKEQANAAGTSDTTGGASSSGGGDGTPPVQPSSTGGVSSSGGGDEDGTPPVDPTSMMSMLSMPPEEDLSFGMPPLPPASMMGHGFGLHDFDVPLEDGDFIDFDQLDWGLIPAHLVPPQLEQQEKGDCEPWIGKALAREMAMLGPDEHAKQSRALQEMTKEGRQMESQLARNRLGLRRLQRGVPADLAYSMPSDGEESDVEGEELRRQMAATSQPPPPTSTPPPLPSDPPPPLASTTKAPATLVTTTTPISPLLPPEKHPGPTQPPPPPPEAAGAAGATPATAMTITMPPLTEASSATAPATPPLTEASSATAPATTPPPAGASDARPGPLPAAAAPGVKRPVPRPAWKGKPAGGEQVSGGEEAGDTEETGGKGGGGEEEEEKDTMWDEQDTTGWSDELCQLFAALKRGRSWGGEVWAQCVVQLLAFERAGGFVGKGAVIAPNKVDECPQEISGWMQCGRKWGTPMKLAAVVGPSTLEGSYGHQWCDWWEQGQPAARKKGRGRLDKIPKGQWQELARMTGRNGMSLYVGTLLWWGEAAAACESSEELLGDWRLAVEDVSAVLGEVLKVVGKGLKKKSRNTKDAEVPKTRSGKRKAPDTAGEHEKENLGRRKRAKKVSGS
ncbi:hypothetical protein C8R47DRAFT_1225128 [Mycena vitilis]|nr:hypothetical protein C8R47DRAFT_1225128 [Mycena vitilis]